jgi:hypothetical protein
MPFNNSNLVRMVQEQMARQYAFNKEIQDTLSEDCIKTIHALLEPNAMVRVSIKEVCDMPFTKRS